MASVFPTGGRAILEQLYDAALAHGTDDQRRALTRRMAETFAARFGPSWGTKSTTPNHPPSKDALAYRHPDGKVDVFDWQNGATREIQVRDGQSPTAPDARTIAGGPPQYFIAVAPIDHLAPPAEPEPVEEPSTQGDPPPGSPDDLEAHPGNADPTLLALVTELLAEAKKQTAELEGIRRDLANGAKVLEQLAAGGTIGDLLGDLFKGRKA